MMRQVPVVTLKLSGSLEGGGKRDGDSGNTSLFAETELDTSHLISLNDSLDVSFDVTDRASFAVV